MTPAISSLLAVKDEEELVSASSRDVLKYLVAPESNTNGGSLNFDTPQTPRSSKARVSTRQRV